MNRFNLPVAKRTRFQRQLLDQGFSGINSGFCGPSSKISKKRNRETGFTQGGGKHKVHEIINLDDDDGDDDDGDDDHDDDDDHGGGGGDQWIKNKASKTDTQNEPDDKIKGYGSASPFKTGKHTYFVNSDDSDNDDTASIVKEEEDAYVDLQASSKLHHVSQNSTKAGSFQSTKDGSSRSSESEKMNIDHLLSMFLGKVKNHLEHEMKMNKIDQSPTDESSDTHAHEKTTAKGKEKDRFVTVKEESDMEESDEDNDGSQQDVETGSLQSTEDDEDDDLDDFDFSPATKRPHQPTKNDKKTASSGSVAQKEKNASVMKKTDQKPIDESSESDGFDNVEFSPVNKRPHQATQNDRETAWSGSASQKEKNAFIYKTNMKKTEQKPLDESSETNVHEKRQDAKDEVKDCYMTVDEASRVKHKKYKMCGKREFGGRLDDILGLIISNEDAQGEKENECIPLKFRFDDSDDESSKNFDEYNGEDLFQEMEFTFECDEIGSYKIPKVEKRETDDYYDDIDPCENGVHGDIYVDEQIGLRCFLCGAVILESRYVIEKLATYALDKSRRSQRLDEQQFYSYEDPYIIDSDSNHYDISKQTKGTVWELVPANIRAHMYAHQQEGFEFLWKNLAETIELSKLQTLGPRGSNGGGCIISHAPGTGKTFLTIVFMESFIKKFPKCCPVIIAPASMLLTWEAEFKKWQVGFSFINVQNSESLRKEMSIGSSRHNKDHIRAMKINSWIKGGGVLGISYQLFEKLTRNSYTRLEDTFLDMPGLVVLDEGHTPRNQNSKIWNTLLKLKTKNRVILSGTPFQNNFRELFNTLRIVRPEIAKSIEKQKFFADMIQRTNTKNTKNLKKYGGGSTSIEKLKAIISPFVHVHKGHILESKLPGLKQSVILLNPLPYQNSFIENLGISASTFEYEHKVALVSVHPSLILHCLLSKKEENAINRQQLEDMRLQPKVGVKTRFVMELIRLSLSLNEKVLIFSQYIQPSELLQEQIALTFGWEVEKEVTVIKGKIKQTHRQKIINAFNDPKSELKVVLASTKCCSEGIHLHGASRVVLLDVVWNPSVETQAICRAYRLGQKKVVYTYHLMAAGTTEEDKYDRQVEKGRLAEMVFSTASMADEEPKNKINVDDKILLEMLDNKEMKEIFRKIRYLEKKSRI